MTERLPWARGKEKRLELQDPEFSRRGLQAGCGLQGLAPLLVLGEAAAGRARLPLASPSSVPGGRAQEAPWGGSGAGGWVWG